MEIIRKYFPGLSSLMIDQLTLLGNLVVSWNKKINIISRKDIPNLYKHHVLHSLSIAKAIRFQPGTHLLDVGTGGGFPGIPLAILFPETKFLLIDSIGKKIKVVQDIANALNLLNLEARQERVEKTNRQFNYIVSRAVTGLPEFYQWVKPLVIPSEKGSSPNGILYLKGGDFTTELQALPERTRVISLHTIFEESFFDTKKIVFIPY